MSIRYPGELLEAGCPDGLLSLRDRPGMTCALSEEPRFRRRAPLSEEPLSVGAPQLAPQFVHPTN